MSHATRTTLTVTNIERIKALMPIDQAAEAVVRCETWSFYYQPGNQAGQFTVWPNGRGAVFFGGNSLWGDWDDNHNVLHLDNGGQVDAQGRVII